MNLILERVLAGRLADKYCRKCKAAGEFSTCRQTWTRERIVEEILSFSLPNRKDLKEKDVVTRRFSCFSARKEKKDEVF